eukprot:Partr_v1_DN24943_c1_g1_i1_m45287 putative f-box protein
MDVAVQSYQRAFRLDPAVEAAMGKLQITVDQPSSSSSTPADAVKKSSTVSGPSTSAEPELIEDLLEYFKALEPVCDIANVRRQHSSTHISKLPVEIMTRFILRHLMHDDPVSVERFSLTCRLFYIYARESSVWRYALDWHTRMGQHPLSTMDSPLDYRLSFLQTPRIRHDGVFIARCHYARQGLTEWGWQLPIHLVTYYRYLRFYRGGFVISVLSNNEPAAVIPLLKLRRGQIVDGVGKGLAASSAAASGAVHSRNEIMTGRWSLSDFDRVVVDVSSSSRPDMLFTTHLSLVSSSAVGMWNKLKWISYSSRRDDGEVLEYPLEHCKSYFFSRVNSFVAADM